VYRYEAGFIGAGSMGGALAEAAVKGAGAEKVAVSCSTPLSTQRAAVRIGCAAATAQEVLRESRYVFLGVKPQMIEDVAAALAPDIRESGAVFVSMLAGVTLARLEELLGEKKIIRIMPNTPCAVGSGLILHCANARVRADEDAAFAELMRCAGALDRLEERLIDAASTVSGCGPAYVYMFIEALADGAVKCGLPRAKALDYAAKTLIGSAEMVLRSGKHPEQLKDEVCSPGGSTIAGVAALENGAFRAACIAAVDAAYEKTKKLG